MAKPTKPSAKGRTLVIRCPDCSASIEVDAATGAVLNHHGAADEAPVPDFDQLLSDIDQKHERANALFEQQREAHEDRDRILEQRFEAVLSRVDEADDDTPPPSPFDLD